MTTETTYSDKNSDIRIRKILVLIDGSEFSAHAAKYAIKIANDENVQLICIHVISTIVLEHALPEYRDDMKKKFESWFNTIKDIVRTIYSGGKERFSWM
jgi:nucleotide-binding universal stress UspA family protein